MLVSTFTDEVRFSPVVLLVPPLSLTLLSVTARDPTVTLSLLLP
ncbi:hypothetical protein APV28_2640 [Comamonas testosteroni]|nr:hypothetical protein APV28_2640 [Comamonas testosteroni]